MGKPATCICENKDADAVTAQLISIFVFAKQIVQFISLNLKFQASRYFCDCTDQFVSNLVGNRDWFPHMKAHLFLVYIELYDL